MASFKFGLIFTTLLLMATTIDVMWFSKTKVMAARNVDSYVLSGLKRRLLPQLNDVITCGTLCGPHSPTDYDCSDCWYCCDCRQESWDLFIFRCRFPLE
ncbi:hypothetical protein R3W88_012479 [Solanum pinnatisectum]|uniref:Uncharacterized protein n=1 Tax=Solanum pinnatisectum TaxID=50273 RepID=A0AAV9L949_9SOLN|nr:hypothetical protein R3W88_012479 [Solanum pinnatisectum]